MYLWVEKESTGASTPTFKSPSVGLAGAEVPELESSSAIGNKLCSCSF
jgi:hypothetical protein